MTQEELVRRALERSTRERVRIVRQADGTYRTRSKSDPGVSYELRVEGELPVCSCPGFAHYRMCKHAAGLWKRLRREYRRSGRKEQGMTRGLRSRALAAYAPERAREVLALREAEAAVVARRRATAEEFGAWLADRLGVSVTVAPQGEFEARVTVEGLELWWRYGEVLARVLPGGPWRREVQGLADLGALLVAAGVEAEEVAA